MASETQLRLRPLSRAGPWPPDDTEESILGTDLHQMTITNLRLGINEAARLHRTPGRPAPWQALSQITLFGCVRPNGTAYKTFPDVFVYRRPIDQSRGSVALDVDGPSALIVEVLSESTYRADLNLERGKGYSYARADVREYLAIDPTGAFLPEGGRAWRLEGACIAPGRGTRTDAGGAWRPRWGSAWRAHWPRSIHTMGGVCSMRARSRRKSGGATRSWRGKMRSWRNCVAG